MGTYGGGGFGFGDIIIILIIAGIIYFVYKRYKATRQMQASTASPVGYSSYAYNEPAYDASYAPQPAGGSVSAGLRYLAEKKINRLENIAVRQVEIVDAVQDEGEEFITVRYTASLLDFTTDETGTVLTGSPTDPVKFLEYWTYARKVGERDWRLAAITQEQDYR
jgi:predicted lipid-binding transport protein (Tim44 family)